MGPNLNTIIGGVRGPENGALKVEEALKSTCKSLYVIRALKWQTFMVGILCYFEITYERSSS